MALPFIIVTLHIKMFTMLQQIGNTIGLIYLFNWLQEHPDMGFVSVRQLIMSCGGLHCPPGPPTQGGASGRSTE